MNIAWLVGTSFVECHHPVVELRRQNTENLKKNNPYSFWSSLNPILSKTLVAIKLLLGNWGWTEVSLQVCVFIYLLLLLFLFFLVNFQL